MSFPYPKLFWVFAACIALEPAAGEEHSWRGEKLADFLESLAGEGVRVIFSSDLVLDDYRLEEEPDTERIEANLPALLAPFGLGISAGPGDSLLVIRRAEPVAAGATRNAIASEPPLPEIIVTSSLQRLENLHTSTHTYFDRELASRVPTTAGEITRVTNHLPGTASGGLSVRNHVRGGEANEVLFLLDGLRLYEPFHLKDFQSVATVVNSNVVEGIDFYTGAFPARYGDRMSGVMSLDLREPGARTETELALSFFNASFVNLGTFGSQRQGEWLASARRGNLDLVVDVVDPEAGQPRYNDVLLHGGWEFGPRATVSANFLASRDKILLNDEARGETARANYRNEVFWFKWSADWNTSLSSETIAAHSTIRNRRRGTLDLPGIVTGTLEEMRGIEVTSLRQDWMLKSTPELAWRFGFDAKHLEGEFDYAAARVLTPPFDTLFDTDPAYSRQTSLDSDGDQLSAYAEARWQLRPRLIAEAGVRWDRQGYTLADDEEQFSPRLSFLYRVGRQTELRLGWGQFSQAQEINELQVSDGVYDYFPAQRAEHVVANLEHRFTGDFDLELSVYRKSFRKLRPRYENAFNALSIIPELQFDRVRIDARKGESRGAELTLAHQSDDSSLAWWVSYAWASVEDELADGELRRSWDQPHTGKAGVSWKWHDWSFSAAARVHSGWPETVLYDHAGDDPDAPAGPVLEITPLNSRRYATYHTLDVRVSRDIVLDRGRLTLFLDVTNLYDRANPCCTEYSIIDDGDATRLAGKQTRWLPIVPSLGVVWSF